MFWSKVFVSPKTDAELIHGMIRQLVVLILLLVTVKTIFIRQLQVLVPDAITPV